MRGVQGVISVEDTKQMSLVRLLAQICWDGDIERRGSGSHGQEI